jgi:putative copper resistance protein D
LIWLLRDFDLLSVLLRALTLGLEMLTLGGVAYLLVWQCHSGAGESALESCWRGVRWAGTRLAIVEVCYVSVDSAILMGSSSPGTWEIWSSRRIFWPAWPRFAELVALRSRESEAGRQLTLYCPLPSLVLTAVVSTSHSVSRMEDRWCSVLTAAHQLGASVWIGAMPFLLISLKRAAEPDEGEAAAAAIFSDGAGWRGHPVAGRLRDGVVLSGISADKSLSGMYGTAYGVMMISKVYLVVLVMALGAGNFFLVKRIETAPVDSANAAAPLWRGGDWPAFTAVLAAASMTSQPPAVDLPNDRASLQRLPRAFIRWCRA